MVQQFCNVSHNLLSFLFSTLGHNLKIQVYWDCISFFHLSPQLLRSIFFSGLVNVVGLGTIGKGGVENIEAIGTIGTIGTRF